MDQELEAPLRAHQCAGQGRLVEEQVAVWGEENPQGRSDRLADAHVVPRADEVPQHILRQDRTTTEGRRGKDDAAAGPVTPEAAA
jgi:hypothetical protein